MAPWNGPRPASSGARALLSAADEAISKQGTCLLLSWPMHARTYPSLCIMPFMRLPASSTRSWLGRMTLERGIVPNTSGLTSLARGHDRLPITAWHLSRGISPSRVLVLPGGRL